VAGLAGLAGLGVGLVSVPRFERTVKRFGNRVLHRLFLPAEIDYAGRRRTGTESLAVRLAAKWAGRDALRGLGFDRVSPRELEVARLPTGAPTLEARGPIAARLEEEGLRFTVSLTHDRELAMASVWLERAPRHASASLSRR
jgi:holo-[acyl-carrier protein] synthase